MTGAIGSLSHLATKPRFCRAQAARPFSHPRNPSLGAPASSAAGLARGRPARAPAPCSELTDCLSSPPKPNGRRPRRVATSRLRREGAGSATTVRAAASWAASRPGGLIVNSTRLRGPDIQAVSTGASRPPADRRTALPEVSSCPSPWWRFPTTLVGLVTEHTKERRLAHPIPWVRTSSKDGVPGRIWKQIRKKAPPSRGGLAKPGVSRRQPGRPAVLN